ncbi:hypothetical protein BK133_00750 [Paenibacillus sp. FSL H8-0548]|nr:hypothetical protein BK133_00750 [Paenibacillus sp. FSL H8-0548]
MTEPIKLIDLYKDGLCMCMAAMKGKHITINEKLHASTHFRIYMCIKCNKPVYGPSYPYR